MTSDPGEKAATNRASDSGNPARLGRFESIVEGEIEEWQESPHRAIRPDESTSPGFPKELSAVCVDGRALLSWQGREGASSHLVQRASSASGPFMVIARVKSGETLSYSDSPPNGTWFYRVSAIVSDSESLPSSTVRVAVPGELRCWIPFNDGFGTAAEGQLLSGEGVRIPVAATLMPGTGWAEGRSSGMALSFETATAYALLPSGLLMNLGDFTISLWARAHSWRAASCLLHIGSDAGSYLRIVQRQRDPGSACLRFAVSATGTGDEQAVDAAKPMTLGRWVHVGVTLQACTGKIFLDGKLVGSGALVSFLPFRLANDAGRLGWGGGTCPAFDGRIQDLRLFSKALTRTEMALLARMKSNPIRGIGP